MAAKEFEKGNFFDKIFDMGKAPLRCEEGETLDGIVNFFFEELEFLLVDLSTANAVRDEVYQLLNIYLYMNLIYNICTFLMFKHCASGLLYLSCLSDLRITKI
jgi:hypothetical protein